MRMSQVLQRLREEEARHGPRPRLMHRYASFLPVTPDTPRLSLGEGFTLVRREYMTAIGPVDLLCRDAAGATVAVEVKRRGEIDGVEQLTRYLELLDRDPLLTPVTGVFAAQQIKPQARTLAVDRGIRCVVVDYDALRGRQSDDLRLF